MADKLGLAEALDIENDKGQYVSGFPIPRFCNPNSLLKFSVRAERNATGVESKRSQELSGRSYFDSALRVYPEHCRRAQYERLLKAFFNKPLVAP